MRGQVKNTPYPQPEGTLGEAMTKYGKDLGDDSNFGMALCDMGESLRQMAGIKYALEDNIKQNFLDPLAQIKDNDLKEVMVSPVSFDMIWVGHRRTRLNYRFIYFYLSI